MIAAILAVLAVPAQSPGLTFVDSRPATFTYERDVYLEPAKASSPESSSFLLPMTDPGLFQIEVDGNIVVDRPDKKGPALAIPQRVEVSVMGLEKKSVMKGHFNRGDFKQAFPVLKPGSFFWDHTAPADQKNSTAFFEPPNGHWVAWSVWLTSYNGPGAFRGKVKVTAPAYGYIRVFRSFENEPATFDGMFAQQVSVNKPGYYACIANYEASLPGGGKKVIPITSKMTVKVDEGGLVREKSRAGSNVILLRVTPQAAADGANFRCEVAPVARLKGYSGSLKIVRYPFAPEPLSLDGRLVKPAG
ncbi:MAG TPA: hypothetical protein PLX06_08440 [Fimbriimonadaceae bacterium]|nr:hypothetical protein [Fimbriimonadaceae bacterium]